MARDTFETAITDRYTLAEGERPAMPRKVRILRGVDMTGGREREVSEGTLRKGNQNWLRSAVTDGHSLGWAPEKKETKGKVIYIPLSERVDQHGVRYGTGHCGDCGKPVDTKWTKCAECLEIRREKDRARRQRNRETGMCGKCGLRPPAAPGLDQCTTCNKSKGGAARARREGKARRA